MSHPRTKKAQERPFVGNLPDGSVSTDVRAYLKAWRDLARPIAEALGGQLAGMDPSLMITVPYLAEGCRSVRIDVETARRLGAAIELRRERDRFAASWRRLAAAAATVEHGVVDPRLPRGFRKAIGGWHWFYVRLGSLVLRHDGEWDWSRKDETARQRMKYAHRTATAALAALRAAVAPDEPACAPVADVWIQAEKKSAKEEK